MDTTSISTVDITGAIIQGPLVTLTIRLANQWATACTSAPVGCTKMEKVV